jgi:hypothetical protein
VEARNRPFLAPSKYRKGAMLRVASIDRASKPEVKIMEIKSRSQAPQPTRDL